MVSVTGPGRAHGIKAFAPQPCAKCLPIILLWNGKTLEQRFRPVVFTTPLLRIPASCITGGERRGDEGGTGVDDKAKQRRKQRIGVGVSHAREGLAVPLTRCHATSVPLHVLRSRPRHHLNAFVWKMMHGNVDATQTNVERQKHFAQGQTSMTSRDEFSKFQEPSRWPASVWTTGRAANAILQTKILCYIWESRRMLQHQIRVRRRRAHAMSKSIRWVIFLKTGDAKDSRSRWRNLLAKEKLNVRATLHQGVTHDCAPQTSQNQEMCMIQA